MPLSGRCLLLVRAVHGHGWLQAGLEPTSGNVDPGAVVEVRRSYRGGGGKGENGMGLGNGGPHASRDLAIFPVQQLVRLRGKFPGAAVVLRSGHGCSSRLAVRYRRDDQVTACVAALTAGIAYRGLTRCAVRWVVRLHCVAGWGGFGFSWRFMRFLLLLGPAAAQRTTVATQRGNRLPG